MNDLLRNNLATEAKSPGARPSGDTAALSREAMSAP
jgi:hypothetical protein